MNTKKKPIRFVTDDPQTNEEAMHNLAFIYDDEVWMRNSGDHGQDIPLTAFVEGICKKCGCDFLEYAPLSSNVEKFSEFMFDCAFMSMCPVANAYMGLCGFAEVRELLKMHEEGNAPEEDADENA